MSVIRKGQHTARKEQFIPFFLAESGHCYHHIWEHWCRLKGLPEGKYTGEYRHVNRGHTFLFENAPQLYTIFNVIIFDPHP